MPLANLIAGQPFKVAVRALALFLVIYLAASVVLVRTVQDSLLAELQAQTQAESLLLREMYRDEGQQGVINALQQIERTLRPPERLAGLLDANGTSLTGPISVLPNFVGISHREVSELTSGRVEGKYLLNVRKLDALTLVIGRNGAPAALAGQRLRLGLGVFGLTVSVMFLGLGLWASRTSLRRLQDMENALARVSNGDMNARLPVLHRDDQFDRVSARMNQNLDRLSRLMAGMKSTASAIAHDLKTPLSHMQIALSEAADAIEAGRDPLPKIDAAIERAQALNAIFDTMLRISRIQANADKSRFEDVDLCKLAGDAVEFMMPVFEDHGQTLRFASAEATVLADPSMLQQALINLLQNATVHAGKEASICVALHDDPECTCLSVEDNGPGIPNDAMKKVLDPFVRLDRARTTPGSGLGLSLVQAVAEHHDAELVLTDARPGLKVELIFPKFKKV